MIHRIKLIYCRTLLNHRTTIEIYYCSKCHREYTEYKDVNPIYWSNFEWLYDDYEEFP